MLSFNEWLEKRMDEGSLGLKRRERVAAGMAKRAERIGEIFPNPSDSRNHLATNQAERDAQSMAYRHSNADVRMQRRTDKRLNKMTQGDREARQMMGGAGGIDVTRSNADRSRQSLSALANYNRPEILAKRGQDPNWAADGRSASELVDKERERRRKSMEIDAERQRQKDYETMVRGNLS